MKHHDASSRSGGGHKPFMDLKNFTRRQHRPRLDSQARIEERQDAYSYHQDGSGPRPGVAPSAHAHHCLQSMSCCPEPRSSLSELQSPAVSCRPLKARMMRPWQDPRCSLRLALALRISFLGVCVSCDSQFLRSCTNGQQASRSVRDGCIIRLSRIIDL